MKMGRQEKKSRKREKRRKVKDKDQCNKKLRGKRRRWNV
jgi:hypothetical protein